MPGSGRRSSSKSAVVSASDIGLDVDSARSLHNQLALKTIYYHLTPSGKKSLREASRAANDATVPDVTQAALSGADIMTLCKDTRTLIEYLRKHRNVCHVKLTIDNGNPSELEALQELLPKLPRRISRVTVNVLCSKHAHDCNADHFWLGHIIYDMPSSVKSLHVVSAVGVQVCDFTDVYGIDRYGKVHLTAFTAAHNLDELSIECAEHQITFMPVKFKAVDSLRVNKLRLEKLAIKCHSMDLPTANVLLAHTERLREFDVEVTGGQIRQVDGADLVGMRHAVMLLPAATGLHSLAMEVLFGEHAPPQARLPERTFPALRELRCHGLYFGNLRWIAELPELEQLELEVRNYRNQLAELQEPHSQLKKAKFYTYSEVVGMGDEWTTTSMFNKDTYHKKSYPNLKHLVVKDRGVLRATVPY